MLPSGAGLRGAGALPRQVAREQMRGRDGILCGRSLRSPPVSLTRQLGREALIEALDRQVEGFSQKGYEAIRFFGLSPALSAQRHREADDDAHGLLPVRELGEPGDSLLARGTLDNSERARDSPGGVGDGDA